VELVAQQIALLDTSTRSSVPQEAAMEELVELKKLIVAANRRLELLLVHQPHEIDPLP
jgi:hypothetical protein